MTDIPEWAKQRVCDLVNEEVGGPDYVRPPIDLYRYSAVAKTFARYITEHEEEPVDPLQEALETGAAAAYKECGHTWPGSIVIAQKQLAELRKRGIEPAKEGKA